MHYPARQCGLLSSLNSLAPAGGCVSSPPRTCSRSPILDPVSWLPSRPASGEVLGLNTMLRVGGSIWPAGRQAGRHRQAGTGRQARTSTRVLGPMGERGVQGKTFKVPRQHDISTRRASKAHATALREWSAGSAEAGKGSSNAARQQHVHNAASRSGASASSSLAGPPYLPTPQPLAPGGSACCSSGAPMVSAMPAAATPATETMSPATAPSSSTAAVGAECQQRCEAGWAGGRHSGQNSLQLQRQLAPSSQQPARRRAGWHA